MTSRIIKYLINTRTSSLKFSKIKFYKYLYFFKIKIICYLGTEFTTIPVAAGTIEAPKNIKNQNNG